MTKEELFKKAKEFEEKYKSEHVLYYGLYNAERDFLKALFEYINDKEITDYYKSAFCDIEERYNRYQQSSFRNYYKDKCDSCLEIKKPDGD